MLAPDSMVMGGEGSAGFIPGDVGGLGKLITNFTQNNFRSVVVIFILYIYFFGGLKCYHITCHSSV